MNNVELCEGEAVYKIMNQLNPNTLRTQFRTYDHVMKAKQILSTLTGYNPHMEAIARNKHNGYYYRISTLLLGYVRGTRVGGGREGVMLNDPMRGYYISWQQKNYNRNIECFEDETRLLPLKDIIILDPDELRAELLNV